MAWASLLEKEVSSCRNEDKFSEKKINHSKTLVSFSETLIYFSKTCSLADQIASLEAQLKTARLAQGAESTNAREILKSAARVCESVDSTDEVLASVGWDLRKGRSPSQILPTPTRLSLRPSGFPGEMIARWSRVINFRYLGSISQLPVQGAPSHARLQSDPSCSPAAFTAPASGTA